MVLDTQGEMHLLWVLQVEVVGVCTSPLMVMQEFGWMVVLVILLRVVRYQHRVTTTVIGTPHTGGVTIQLLDIQETKI